MLSHLLIDILFNDVKGGCTRYEFEHISRNLLFYIGKHSKNYLTFFAKMDKVRFRNKILPGDTIIFRCFLIGPFRRGICHMQGLAYANGKLCAEAELTAQITKVK